MGNRVICNGCFMGKDIEDGVFHGGEIDPGTFHEDIPVDAINPLIDLPNKLPLGEEQIESEEVATNSII